MLRINQQCNRFLFSPANLTLLAWLVAGSAHLDRNMFSLMLGPTVAAVSTVMAQAEETFTVQQAFVLSSKPHTAGLVGCRLCTLGQGHVQPYVGSHSSCSVHSAGPC